MITALKKISWYFGELMGTMLTLSTAITSVRIILMLRFQRSVNIGAPATPNRMPTPARGAANTVRVG